MSNLIERLRKMHEVGVSANTQSEYMAAGEAFIRASKEIIKELRELTAERDDLRQRLKECNQFMARDRDEADALLARIDGAVTGTVASIGDDENGQPRAVVHSTRDELMRGPAIACKRVALVVVE
jgi:hypothetical protein